MTVISDNTQVTLQSIRLHGRWRDGKTRRWEDAEMGRRGDGKTRGRGENEE
ncbi:hypothetical protein [Anabaena lutea]|uniref:Uncharacterized protein n=1 Tax=Anabaena lutea FACHB-196 TaxID=2692881 RepID=A0ABR8FJV8_9NOST|nr:hypothetical protein [Anabaena lutea]MBD2570273.1 hypothetical protein [Anabaena lutea FACHB-196]